MHDAERLEESRRLGPPVCSPLLGMVLSTAQALIPLFLCQQALRARSEFKYPDWNACSSRKRLFNYRRVQKGLSSLIGRDNWLGLKEWAQLAEAMKESSELAKIQDFPWTEDLLQKKDKVDLRGSLIHDGCSGLKSPSFIVFVKLLQRPSAASITELDLRFSALPNLAF